MKTIIAILILFTSFEIVSAQVTQEWVSRYNGPVDSIDNPSSSAVDGSGNLYVTGYSFGSGTGYDYATIKYNSSGVQQWAARYNGPENVDDNATSIAVDGSGNVYVTGSSREVIHNYADYATIKYNSSGVQQWVARYFADNLSNNEATSITLDGLGNVYVTGCSTSGTTNGDYLTIKYNSSGDSVWVKRYNGTGNGTDYPISIALDGSSNVYVTGYSRGSVTGNDYLTIKYNSAGVQQWAARYNGFNNFTDNAYSIALDGSGNVYVTGGSAGNGGSPNYATIKYNSSGDSVWVKRYKGFGIYAAAKSIAVDGSGNVFVTGWSVGSGGESDYATIKYNSSGDSVWVKRYNGPGNLGDTATSLALDGSGNVYVTGSSRASGGNYDYATIKYNSSGDSVWVKRYNGTGNKDDYAKSLTLDGSGNVYVTGMSRGSGTAYDYATIKYSQSVGINQISSTIPEQFSLSQNYPNPFNPTTNIEFSLPEKSFVKLKVFDITGKEVAQLVNENLSAGTFRYEFNAENFPSGLYFYKLETDKFSETKKMIVLK